MGPPAGPGPAAPGSSPPSWTVRILAAFAAAGMAYFAFRYLEYSYRIRDHGVLVARIHGLADTLEALAPAGEEKADARIGLIRRILEAEKVLFRIRGGLKPEDRPSMYRNPLGDTIQAVLEDLGKREFLVPERFIKGVQRHIRHYTRPENRATLIRCFARKPRFEAMIDEELEKAGLPAGFLYVAMLESMFDPYARSGRGARGLWQMMPETAREHGLNVPEEWRVLPAAEDGRTDARASTRAAALHLKSLYSEFGDAALAMAAYNAGASKMRKSLLGIGDTANVRDYWYLYRLGRMSAETRQFVPRVIAMMLIDRNRQGYGFEP
jgi:Transglycosylase SLT domain